MSMHEVAQHLSAMGRKGDSMLVHMSPQEVSAMNGIAALHGTNLGRNPDTGLPEAFNLGGFFKSLLPTIAGAIAAPLTGGTSLLIPVMAGAATGAALNSSNPLMGALTGGLGGFGGAGIGNALKAGFGSGIAGAGGGAGGGAGAISSQSAEAIANAGGAAAGSGQAPLAGMSGTPGGAAAGSMNPQLASATGGYSGSGSPMISGGSTGAKTALESAVPTSGLDKFVQSLGGTGPNADLIAAGKVGLPVGIAALSGIEPPKLPEEDKYDPNFQLNLSGDSGLRFFAEGGDITEMPDPGSNPLQNAQDARNYGIGGLSYAKGGGVFGGQNLNLGGSGVNLGGGAGAYTPQQFEQYYNAYRANQVPTIGFDRLPNMPALKSRAAERGVSVQELMRNPNAGLSPEQMQFNKMMQSSGPQQIPGMQFFANSQYQKNLSPEQKEFNEMLASYKKAGSAYLQSQLTPEQTRRQAISNTGMAGAAGLAYRPVTSVSSYRQPLNIWQGNTTAYSPGMFGGSSQALFAKGGYLDGPGDGMSDSIPATIGGKQPARLADGEFVVPADVVSHLGNGSTKAGAQRLYDMMAKVRKARTGTTKQGKQINPKKYLPA